MCILALYCGPAILSNILQNSLELLQEDIVKFELAIISAVVILIQVGFFNY